MNRVSIPIFPSIMCSKPWEVQDYLAAFEEAGVCAVHFDVMDGHYVPNIMLGTNTFNDIRSMTSLPMDVHLMCLEPERYIPYFNLREGDWVSFHPEVCNQSYRLMQNLRDRGLKAGLALSPGVSVGYLEECLNVLDFVLIMAVNPGFAGQKMVPDHLDKIRRVCGVTRRASRKVEIVVDGNTTLQNAKDMFQVGASGFVTGTSSMMKEGAASFVRLYEEYCATLIKKAD
ncbi:MAG: ribulose-phosphate 3-epimerase [Eubacteriales bacterium]|nr:ribulose-phosphate 3-epimerase [Eubacteriales bacterium]